MQKPGRNKGKGKRDSLSVHEAVTQRSLEIIGRPASCETAKGMLNSLGAELSDGGTELTARNQETVTEHLTRLCELALQRGCDPAGLAGMCETAQKTAQARRAGSAAVKAEGSARQAAAPGAASSVAEAATGTCEEQVPLAEISLAEMTNTPTMRLSAGLVGLGHLGIITANLLLLRYSHDVRALNITALNICCLHASLVCPLQPRPWQPFLRGSFHSKLLFTP